VFTSFVTYLIPIIAIAWGLMDGEILVLGHYFGIVLIIIGVAFANRPKK
jgi:drug/metabolite transporter (DMT)-like permease